MLGTALLGAVAASAAVGTNALIINRQDSVQSILITSQAPGAGSDECLKSSYYGAYGSTAAQREFIYLPSAECLGSAHALDALSEGSLVSLDKAEIGEGRVVWVGQAGVAPELLATDGEAGSMADWFSSISVKAAETTLIKRQSEPHQSHFTASSPKTLRMLHASAHSLLLSVPAEYVPILDTLLPRHLVPVALPQKPYAASAGDSAWEPVPKHLAEHLANITSGLKFDSALDKALNEGLDADQLRRDIRWLTGEGPSGIESRHSFTEGALKAAKYIKGKSITHLMVPSLLTLSEIGEESGATCKYDHFLDGFAPNVLCTYPSTHNSTDNVILSAHYDSRGSFGLTRAPGGDDDGSGSGHLLQIARAFGKMGVKFDKKVTLAWHAGEEQGLYGSHYFAERLKKENATVLLQIQADMLGYHVPGETLQLGLPESIETPEASALLHKLSQLYSPELVLGTTPACCSDHQSFLSFGFPATAVFERNGGIADPMYHNSGDTSQREGYDLRQIISIAKVTMGAVMTVAGWKL